MDSTRGFLVILALALAASLGPAAAAPAAVELAIQISGLSFKYDENQNGSLFDSKSIAGGHGLVGEAARVSLIDFFLGGEKQGSLVYADQLFVDFLIDGIHNIPAMGGFVATEPMGKRFGFDIIHGSERFLALELDAVSVTYTRNQVGSFIQFSFIAGGPSAGVLLQDLPFGLEIDEGQPITVRVSSVNVKNVVESGGYLKSFTANNGTAAVYGYQVPEPASFAALMAIGLIGLKIGSRLKHKLNRRAGRRGPES